MWKEIIPLLVENNISDICIDKNYMKPEVIDELSAYNLMIISKLPWFYRLPIKSLFLILSIYLIMIPDSRKKVYLNIVMSLPLYNIANKLVRNLSFISFFDTSVWND